MSWKKQGGNRGQESRLGTLSECLAPGCEQGYHTVKCLQSNSERLFSLHTQSGTLRWLPTGLSARKQYVYKLLSAPKLHHSTVWFTSLQPKYYSCLSLLKEQSLLSTVFIVGVESLMSHLKLTISQFLNMVIILGVSRETKPIEYIIMHTYLDI